MGIRVHVGKIYLLVQSNFFRLTSRGFGVTTGCASFSYDNCESPCECRSQEP